MHEQCSGSNWNPMNRILSVICICDVPQYFCTLIVSTSTGMNLFEKRSTAAPWDLHQGAKISSNAMHNAGLWLKPQT